MNLLLRVETTEAERKTWNTCDVVAFSFRITDGGGLVVSEEWDGMDESCGERSDIEIPPRIWREAFAWLQKHMQQA